VQVLVLPEIDQVAGQIVPEQLNPSAEIIGAVQSYLSERCLIGSRMEVRSPQYVWLSCQVRLRVRPRSDALLEAEVQRLASEALYRYLNPFIGGTEGKGWPFGRDLHVSEIFALLQRVPNVEFVDEVQVYVREPGRTAGGQPVLGRLDVPPQALVCSYQHRVEVGQ
jgi:hypothetical protein